MRGLQARGTQGGCALPSQRLPNGYKHQARHRNPLNTLLEVYYMTESSKKRENLGLNLQRAL